MFHSARLTLTAWYLIIIMVISGTFSGVIYRVLSREVERFGRSQRFSIEKRLLEEKFIVQFGAPPPVFSTPDDELIAETKKRILYALLMVNGVILIVSGGLGYVLAGQTLQPIKEMLDEQNRFVSDASHELKTPLTSLKAAFEVYLRDSNRTKKDADTLVAESIEEVNKLQLLSESLLELAHYQKKNDNFEIEKIKLKEAAQESLKKVQPMAKRKGISLKMSGEKPEVLGNRDKVVNVLVILLDNAIKFSPEASTVNLVISTKRGKAIVKVIDKGMGISKEDVSRVFDRFYQADEARARTQSGGYGLGLSIAKKSVEAMNGSITVDSKERKGATFTVTLPLASKKPLRI